VTKVEAVNDQTVKAGQPLFHVDRERYALALRQADANVAAAKATLSQARRELVRNRTLGELVAAESTEQSASKVEQADAALAQALAARDVARLNLDRTVVYAPTDGFLSDLTLRTGDYVTAGKPVLALIDSRSFRVEGYFRRDQAVGPEDRHAGQRAGDGRAGRAEGPYPVDRRRHRGPRPGGRRQPAAQRQPDLQLGAPGPAGAGAGGPGPDAGRPADDRRPYGDGGGPGRQRSRARTGAASTTGAGR
jgi:multidrug efflux pump subunit AcrA (membrane-fusion protein)